MFEQSLYEPQEPVQPERVATPPSEGDFLYGYELRTWDLGPRIYKILGISAAANLLALLVFAQTSLLTMKGCDSPLVGGVCQVLDTVYVGAMLFGTDREYVDAAYEKTALGEDYDVTFVDMTGSTPPLSYPDGYFQVANRDELAMMASLANDPTMTSGIPGIPDGIPMASPSINGGSMLDTKPNLPPSNPNSVEGDLPSGFGSNDPTAGHNIPRPRLNKPKRPAKTPPATNPDGSTPGIPDPNQVAEVKPSPSPSPAVEPTGPVAEVEINKRPFVDLANTINGLIDQNQVKLDSQFIIAATGKLDKDGKLDAKTFRYVRAEGSDPKMVEVVKEAIEAMNDSNLLQYLSLLRGKQLTIQIQQNDQTVVAMIQTDFENDMRAQSVATALGLLLGDKKKAKETAQADQNDKDDLVLLQNASVKPTGKKLEVLFNIPKADLQMMIQRKLAEQRNAPKQPNSTSSVRLVENTASRN